MNLLIVDAVLISLLIFVGFIVGYYVGRHKEEINSERKLIEMETKIFSIEQTNRRLMQHCIDIANKNNRDNIFQESQEIICPQGAIGPQGPIGPQASKGIQASAESIVFVKQLLGIQSNY